jgi:4-hydroxybenzoate polyprenyltransferase
MLISRYRRWKLALAAGWTARLPDRVRTHRGAARARWLRARLWDLVFLFRLERVALFGQLAAGFALAAPRWDASHVRLLILAVFCLGPCLYGGLYALNDAADAGRDRLNPAKRGRPVASGRISPTQARRLGAALVGLGLGLALWLDARVLALGLAFLAINLAYTHVFKHLPGWDIAFNMLPHPLRLAGGLWLGGGLEHWPLLAVWALAGLANCIVKRLHEARCAPPASRPVLCRYTERGLLRLHAASLGAALGVWPFLAGWDLAAAGMCVLWAGALIAGHRLPLARRVVQIMGR